MSDLRDFYFSGIVQAESIDHAMLSLAADLIRTQAESEAEIGQLGSVLEITMQPEPESMIVFESPDIRRPGTH